MIPVVRIKILHPKARLPSYATPGAAGLDLYACEDVVLHKTAAISTGIAIEIPEGFEGQVRPRSGLALKHQVTVLNAPGTIDSDYRGEIKVILINHGDSPYTIETGDRIAQLVLNNAIRANLESVTSLTDTDRGAGAFGHSGR